MEIQSQNNNSALASKSKNTKWAIIILNLEIEFKNYSDNKTIVGNSQFFSEGGLVDQGVVGVHNEGFENVQHING